VSHGGTGCHLVIHVQLLVFCSSLEFSLALSTWSSRLANATLYPSSFRVLSRGVVALLYFESAARYFFPHDVATALPVVIFSLRWSSPVATHNFQIRTFTEPFFFFPLTIHGPCFLDLCSPIFSTRPQMSSQGVLRRTLSLCFDVEMRVVLFQATPPPSILLGHSWNCLFDGDSQLRHAVPPTPHSSFVNPG